MSFNRLCLDLSIIEQKRPKLRDRKCSSLGSNTMISDIFNFVPLDQPEVNDSRRNEVSHDSCCKKYRGIVAQIEIIDMYDGVMTPYDI